MPPIFFVLVVVIVVAVAIAASFRTKRIAAEWEQAGAALGLSYGQKGFARPRLVGTIRGMQVQVDVRVQRSGKNQQSYTRYRVWPPSAGFDFRLTRQTGFSRITKFFGAQDVELGDTAFDEAFVVKTSDETRLRTLLDSRLMGVLLRTSAAYPGVVLEDDLVSFERRRVETSATTIVSVVRRLVDTAAALSGGRVPTDREDVITARRRGELAELAAGMRRSRTQKAESLDEQLLELDTLATAGEREAARERLRDLEATVPRDPEVVGWRERLDRPRPTATAPGGVEAEEVAKEMFSGNALSFESKRIFDERYRGATVRWTGRVKSIDRIRQASDLGDSGSDKLIATVASIDHDLYGNTEVDAVVGLRSGSGSGLRRGDEVTFTGTLVRVDALVRNLFVADGKLEKS